MTKHSLLPPSSAARRVACYGSRAMEASMPPETEPSPAALEGEAAHAVAAAFLKLDNPDCNTYVITEEITEGAHLYFNHVMAITKGIVPVIEQTISISCIHPEAFGTPDAWWYDEVKNHLYVWDYKFGHGFVEVFENWQLIAYAAGIFQAMDLYKDVEFETKVTFVIVQPRSYHPDGNIRRWITSFRQLCGYWERLRAVEEYSMRNNAPLTPSPQCLSGTTDGSPYRDGCFYE